MESNSDFFGENQIFLNENEFQFENGFPFETNSDSIVIKTEIQEQNQEIIPQNINEIISPIIEENIEPIIGETPEVAEPQQQTTTTTEQPMEVAEPELPDEEQAVIEEQFTVEAIVGKRVRNKRNEYCVKWLGFDQSENTWEPLANLSCQELIAEYEAKQSTPARRGRKPRESTTTPTTTTVEKTPKTTPKGDGFSRGLKPKRVIGVTEEGGELFYSIEWINDKQVSLIASRIARVKCPQLVIGFLQSKLKFNRKRPREPLENYRPLKSKAFSLFSGARD